jgi:hypothetical protein
MHEYREKAAARNNEGRSSQTAEADLGTRETERFMSLAAQYGLDDMDIGESGANEQTIDQEYRAYITAPLSPKTINILRFWEVGHSVDDTLILLRYFAG